MKALGINGVLCLECGRSFRPFSAPYGFLHHISREAAHGAENTVSDEYRTLARKRMQGFCRVCPSCNGQACAGEVPGMGGLGSGASFQHNYAALAAVTLNMTALHRVTTPDTTCSFLGVTLRAPLMAAPIGGVSFNMSKEVGEDEYIDAVLSGCQAAGIVGCTGDGVPPFIIEAAEKALKAHGGIPFIKPWEGQELYDKLQRVGATNPLAVGVDVDAAGLVTLRKMGRPVAPVPVEKLAQLCRFVHDDLHLPFIVKGIMSPGDAEKAISAGADALVVSNHGGRVLDHCPGTAAVLPHIAAAVRGRTLILVDGAVRSGVDALKMLALGADAVLIGRPVCAAALGGGAEGVTAYFERVIQELSQAMLLTGAARIADITPEILFTR